MIDTKKYYTEEDMIMLDMEMNFIPLTFDKLFKGIFKKDLNLLKKFILSQLEFDIDLDECKIELLDSEIFKDKMSEYQKSVDIYVKIGNVYVNIEINREYFRNVSKRNLLYADKLYGMLLKDGDDIKSLEDKIFVQINLNAIDKLDDKKEKLKYGKDTLVVYGMHTGKVYGGNKYVLVKYLEYYRDLYYNKKEKLDESCLWLVLFASRNYVELFNVANELFDEETRDIFVRKVIDMGRDSRFFEDWEIEKLNELVAYKREQHAIEDGLQQGIEQGIEQTIKNMLKENIDIELISKVTNKSNEEILDIKKSMEIE